MTTQTKPRLGKGLDALFGPTVVDQPATALASIDKIDLNPHQPRKQFDAEELAKLTESIMEHGLLQPVAVRKAGDRFQLIAGERRLRACKEAGLTEIPVHVLELNDQQVFEAALVENIQRADLNPIEKAQGFKDYLERFAMSQEQLASKIGVDRTSISNLLGLLNLAPEVREFVRSGQLSLGHAKVLKGVPEHDRQVTLAKEVIAKNLSVHALEPLAKEQKEVAAQAKGQPKSGFAKTKHVQSIESELRQKLALRVAIKLKSKEKGQIVLTFDSNDDFERLLEVLRK
ncbi:MAG: ParB/RepB/Spo0J family partition protein [Gemmataceae bacterium]